MARFFKDRPDILIPIRWLPANPKAPRVPWSSSFMSLDWTSSQQASNEPNFQDEPWLQTPGEVFNEPRPYNAATKLLGMQYDHVCGTEDQFAFGATYDPMLNVQYDEQGLPLCCNGPAVPFFGLVMGFEIDEAPPPPGITLGFSCTFAPTDTLDGAYTLVPDSSAAIGSGWMLLNVTVGSTYTVTLTGSTEPTGHLQLFEESTFFPQCHSLVAIGAELDIGDSRVFTAGAGLRYFFFAFSDAGTYPITWTVNVNVFP